MKRRHLVVLVSAFTLLTVIFLAAVTVGVGVGTDAGREQIRSLVQQQLSGRVDGKVHIGTIRGGFLTGFTLDSFAIRDEEDSLLVSTGRVKVEYDLRDLIDRRLLLRNVEVERPFVRLRQYEEGGWNFQKIFRGDDSPRRAPNVPGRGFGDFIVLDSVTVRGGEFVLIRPWNPDASLTGAAREAAIAEAIADTGREIRPARDGFAHVYRWSKIDGFLPLVRLAHPDSGRFGRLIVVQSLRADETEPPFKFRNVRGNVRVLGDSVLFEVAHFDLPASTGSASGKVWWGNGTRVDVRVRGDSVSLRDVAWVYPTFPREGSGSTDLRITNDSADNSIFQFALSNLDARSTKSRLTGAMTFEIGHPVLVVKDVDVRAAPVNFDLLRTFAGEPLPVDWQGNLYGFVRGPGGPLTDFAIAESDVIFRDDHVRGAVSRFAARGVLDILDPALTSFKGFEVNASNLDLRSVEFLFPGFPRIGGTIHGVVTLDSSWLDVRFSRANITHRNGPEEPSRFTGSGRVTYGEEFLAFDASVNAQPLSLTMMSRAYDLGLKGVMSGPIRVRGTADNLDIATQLEGAAGKFSYAGRVDLYPLSVSAVGAGRMDTLDIALLLESPKAPEGWVTGSYRLDVRGDTNDLGTLRGSASLAVERAELDSLRIFPSRVHVRFGEGRMYVDTLRVESVAASVTAAGALGLSRRTADSLVYQIRVDSLGGLRRYVTRVTSAWRPAGAAASDSLSGSLHLLGFATGSLKALDASGRVTGRDLHVRREAGRDIVGSFALSDVFGAAAGRANVRLRDLKVGRVALDTLGAELRLGGAGGRSGSFSIGALAKNGVMLSSAGEVVAADGSTEVAINSIALATDSSRWTLRQRASVRVDQRGLSIDTVRLANGRGGVLWVAANVPDTGAASLLLRADSVSLRDFGLVTQLRAPLAGWGSLTIQGIGTSAAPIMSAHARLQQVRYGGLAVERLVANADYLDRRARVAMELGNRGRTALVARGSLPVELSYFGGQLLDDSLSGTIRTDSASFEIIEALVPGLTRGTGRLIANVDVSGTWSHPDITGPVRVENGEVDVEPLGIRLRGVNVDIALFGHRDSLAIRRFTAWSGATAADSVSLSGHVLYRDLKNPYLDLRLIARTFSALNKRSLAQLDVSTEPAGLRLRGQLRGAVLTGGLIVNRGTIYLPDPEIRSKQVADFATVMRDTLAGAFGPVGPGAAFRGIVFDAVRVSLGDEVWLRSREARIKLGGSLNVQRRVRRATMVTAGGLVGSDSTFVPVLDGVLIAERGTYTLDLGRVVQRDFQVEEGTVTFFGSEELPAELDISALHTVRTSKGDALRIRVRLTGPISNPIVNLESAESFALSQSDLVSYLIFGQQNFELTAERKNYVSLAASTLFPSAQSFAANQLRGLLGPLADIIELRPGSADPSVASNQRFTDYFLNYTIGSEKQVTDNLFLSVSTGLCQFKSDQQGAEASSEFLNFLDGLSWKAEYRLSRDASLKAAREPAASTCSGASSGRVVPAPAQWGFSLFKTWRF